MKTLQETLASLNNDGGKRQTLVKHLSAVGIREWSDITRGKLFELKDHLVDADLASGSQKTVLANLKSILNRVRDDIDIPKDYAKILTVKTFQTEKTFLSEEDLRKLEAYTPRTQKQEYVKNTFLICAYTGLRVSDAEKLVASNVVGCNLHYVAKKTKKANSIPLKSGLEERIKWMNDHPEFACTRTYYNRIIKKICREAGIDEEVMVFKADEEKHGPKWKFISSHSARVSTATDLFRRGVQIGDIQTLLQHSSMLITEKYIVKDRVQLSDEALKFFE